MENAIKNQSKLHLEDRAESSHDLTPQHLAASFGGISSLCDITHFVKMLTVTSPVDHTDAGQKYLLFLVS